MNGFLLTIVMVLSDSTTKTVDYPHQPTISACTERGNKIVAALKPTTRAYSLCIEVGNLPKSRGF